MNSLTVGGGGQNSEITNCIAIQGEDSEFTVKSLIVLIHRDMTV